MECGKLTAKLRDAVPVCFMVNGREVNRYKNIEIPAEIKHLPYFDFKFDVPENGAITFKIHFEPGVLPDVWPDARQRQRRVKAAPPAESMPIGTVEADAEDQPGCMEIHFGLLGDERKRLVSSVGEYTGHKPVYQNPPTFAYRIGTFMVDKRGTLIGPNDQGLLRWLKDERFEDKQRNALRCWRAFKLCFFAVNHQIYHTGICSTFSRSWPG